MPVNHINDIMTNKQNWAKVGLGESGETYIVADDFTLRNQSRFLIEDREQYLPKLAETGSSPDTIARIRSLNTSIGLRSLLFNMPPWFGYSAARIIGLFVNDIFLTREEIHGLMGNTLAVDTDPTGTAKLSEWINDNKQSLGYKYASELGRRTDRTRDYWTSSP